MTDDDHESLARVVKGQLKRCGVTHAQLARALGVEAGVVTRMLRPRPQGSPDKLRGALGAIADLCGTTEAVMLAEAALERGRAPRPTVDATALEERLQAVEERLELLVGWALREGRGELPKPGDPTP